jgi:hypothetical protein
MSSGLPVPGTPVRERSARLVKKLKNFLHKSSQSDQNSDRPIDFYVDFVLAVRSQMSN